MKKQVVSVLLASAVALSLAACGKTEEVSADVQEAMGAVENAAAEESAVAAAATEDVNAKSEGVMTYAEYAAAPVDSEVTVETYVQAAQSWWDNTGTFYTQDGEGGYFLYSMPISEDDYKKLTPGTRIKVKGFKSEWSGEVEITDATYEIEDGNYVAEAVDVTDKLGTDGLADYMNRLVSFKGMTVEAANDAGDAYMYNWDGSGSQGDDLYFNVSSNGATYTFCVESYLCGADTDVYKTIEGWKVGDTVDLEGFLYWYEGAQPHITSVTVK